MMVFTYLALGFCLGVAITCVWATWVTDGELWD